MDFFKHWGKARPVAEAATSHHLLVYHSLDVAAVGAAWLERSRHLLQWMAQTAGLPVPALLDWLTFWLALHDIGKFATPFQAQRLDLVQMLQGHSVAAPALGAPRHDSLGLSAWQKWLAPLATQERWWGETAADHDMSPWAHAVTGHHGQPGRPDLATVTRYFSATDQTSLVAFVRAMRDLFITPSVMAAVCATEPEDFEVRSQRLSWWVAGVAVLADWIGSNTEFFPYEAQPDTSLARYWQQACARAHRALDQTGVLPAARPQEQPWARLFPHIRQPSALQAWAQQTALGKGPQLHLLEDVTGAGKTEAAVMLAHRLMVNGCADGYFIGLPTMATANAMYQRLVDVHARLFASDASLTLAHGRKDLVEMFAASVLRAGKAEADPAQQDDSATTRCTRWLADHNKRALLAPAGVGTVDQALLAVLQSKHQSLRLLGLFRKVLIVDEVHACDAYMQRTLEVLLRCHAASGGSAILLSATLPQGMKQRLFDAYAQGCGAQRPALIERAYPLITSWTGTPGAVSSTRCEEVAVPTRSDVRRTVQVHYTANLDAVLAHIAEALAQGQCVGWIRNTIGDALAAQALLCERVAPEGITLFHARFTLGDRLDIETEVLAHLGARSGPAQRRGRLLIATQVAEQSLDVDLDVLVSDLAPIDRLIQRAGRLCRHVRNQEGERLPLGAVDGRGAPQLWVYGPAWAPQPGADWFRQTFEKAACVYDDHAQLWLSAQQLQAGRFTMPEDARPMMEAVYGDVDIPPGLGKSHQTAQGKGYGNRSSAQSNTIKLEEGYVRSGLEWLADTSAPSRLGEDTVDVVLGRWVNGQVQPWRADKAAHAWAYSTLRVPRRLIDQAVPPATPEQAHAADAALASMPGGGRWVVLLVLAMVNGQWQGQALSQAQERRPAECRTWVYDGRRGLVAEAAPVPR